MKRQKYAPEGLLALNPKAFGLVFNAPEAIVAPDIRDGIGVVEVCGPLMHHPDFWFDSYDAIKDRVADTLEKKPKAIVLKIDSPGGLVSGCFDSAREIRAMCDAEGVPLYAFVDGQSCSAAYALACVASQVWIPPTGTAGSIGVIDMLCDVTAMNASNGVNYAVVSSGARKADGNPNAPITKEAVAAAQIRVDRLAELFFDHVAAFRSSLSSDDVRAMEAGLFIGAQAQAMGLADAVGSFDQMFAAVAAATGDPAMTVQANTPAASSEYEEGVAKLRKAAEGDDENAKAARKMLVAMEESGDDDEKKKDEESKAKAEETPSDEKKDDEEAKALAKAARADAAEARALAEKGERARLMATRPDLTDAQAKAMAKVPLPVLESTLAAIPRTSASPAATATVAATRGQGQGGIDTPAASSPELEEMDRAMGITSPFTGIKREGTTVSFGVMSREQARAHVAAAAKQNGGV